VTDPLDVDPLMQRRVSTKVASLYLGCSVRHVEDLVHEGELDAIDFRSPGAERAAYGVTVASLRRYLAIREVRAEKKEANGANSDREPASGGVRPVSGSAAR
jgi:hypothetical protein